VQVLVGIRLEVQRKDVLYLGRRNQNRGN
jgi:hypothetical protein